jgi:hypothetical protein
VPAQLVDATPSNRLIGQHFSQGTDPQVQPINPFRIAAAFDHPSPTRRDTIRRTEANEED